MTDNYPEITERFKRETADHEMTVLHDEGIYRHVRFRAPKTSFYWFDLTTWPGFLSFTGDMDGYVFSRVDDMFGFFRQSRSYGINPHYWSEKVVASRDRVKTYSQKLFRERIAEDAAEAEGDYPGLAGAVEEHFFGRWSEWNTEYEPDARAAIDAFKYQPDGHTGAPFTFDDAWEWELRDYDWTFLWCCHAIVWGIGQYDAARKEAA